MAIRSDQPVAVIIDGHSTGKFLVREFIERGVPCVHVQTGEYGMAAIAHDERYLARLDTRGGLDALAEALSGYRVACVVPGLEGQAVDIADALASAVGAPGNPVASVAARRDKARMAEALQRHGVRHIPHAEASDAAGLIDRWREWGERPVVVKPTNSAGSEDVTVCTDKSAIFEAVARIVGKVNACEEVNRAAIMQPRLVGAEYIVNAVSRDGVHVATDVWRCYKVSGPNGTPLDEHSDLVHRDDPVLPAMLDYLEQALDAVDIRWGASHAEIIVDDNGPVLVEVGARLMGGTFDHDLLRPFGVYGQVEAAVDIYLDPDRFAAYAETGYGPTHSVRTVDLQPTRFGTITGVDLSEVRELPSYLVAYLPVGVGDVLADPVDRNTHVGYVNLAHASPTQIESDYQRLRAIEGRIFALEADRGP